MSLALSPVRAFLPADAGARRDRGEGLFVVRAPVASPYFRCEAAGALWRLYPTAALLAEFERPEAAGALSRSFSRFRGLPVDAESLGLFCAAAKLAEAPEPARAAALERALRQRAALCQRLGGGGGLYACALLFEKTGGNCS